MSLDSDLALFGTGIAPLVAACHLMEQGISVLILNPDRDFFLEDSELPLDPLLPLGLSSLKPERIKRSDPDWVLSQLRPGFPGAVEFAAGPDSGGYRDASAPYVRSRSRLWLTDGALGPLEDLYVEASDADLNPLTIEGLAAGARFPGGLAREDRLRGLSIPKLADVDVQRYRNGLLEFVLERLGPDRILCSAGQLEFMPGGIRFHSDAGGATARLKGGLVSFWTPRLTPWVLSLAKEHGSAVQKPSRVRLWEQWGLVSRHPVDPSVVGVIDGAVVWAEVEGSPKAQGSAPFQRLSVLRSAGAVDAARWGIPQELKGFASGESFEELSRLFHDRYRWEYVTIRSMKTRALLEWDGGAPSTTQIYEAGTRLMLVPGSDGPLAEVVATAREAAIQVEGWAE